MSDDMVTAALVAGGLFVGYKLFFSAGPGLSGGGSGPQPGDFINRTGVGNTQAGAGMVLPPPPSYTGMTVYAASPGASLTPLQMQSNRAVEDVSGKRAMYLQQVAAYEASQPGKDVGGSTLKGTAIGAGLGASFGPIGAAVGGAVGAIGGFFSSIFG